MTAFTQGTDVPDSIATVEQMVLWGISLLELLYRGQTYKEANGSAIDSGLAPLVDLSIVNAADGTKRAVARIAIELHPDYVTDKTKKFWLFADEFGQAGIPATFKVD